MINQASQVSSALDQMPELTLKEILFDDKQGKILLVDNQIEVYLLTPLQLNLSWPGGNEFFV